MRLRGNVVLELAFVAFLGVLVVTAFEYNERARLIPLLIGVPTFLMALTLLVADTIPAVGSRLAFVRQRGFVLDSSELKSDAEGELADEEHPKFTVRALRLFLWLAFFVFLLRVVNYIAAVPVFIFLIMVLEARERLITSAATAAVMGLFIFALFKVFLQATF